MFESIVFGSEEAPIRGEFVVACNILQHSETNSLGKWISGWKMEASHSNLCSQRI